MLVYQRVDIIQLGFQKKTNYQKPLSGVSPPKPIGSMYGIFTYICHTNQPNVGKYTIHGSYGKWKVFTWVTFNQTFSTIMYLEDHPS